MDRTNEETSGRTDSKQIHDWSGQKTPGSQEDRIGETWPVYHAERKDGYTIEDYYALPEEKRAELIDGVFYDMASPTSIHQMVIITVTRMIGNYIKQKKGKCILFNSPMDVQLDCDDHTMVQPDVMIVCDRNKIRNRCIYGAPDFVVEILSPSTGRKDSTIKLAKYRAAGVKEYWMVDTDRKKVIVYEFTKEETPIIYGMDQIVPIGIFDGECRVDFREVYEDIRFLAEQEQIGETWPVYHAERKDRYTIEDYYALPDEKRVELIDGVFYDMAAPTVAHQMVIRRIMRFLEDHIDSEGGSCIPLASPVDVQIDCDDDTMLQPDVLVVCDREKILNRCIYGAPDFIVEVLSPSTGWKDASLKLAKYRAAGVREYWMVDIDRRKVIVYEFEKSEMPMIYGMEEQVPVGIFGGACRIDFAEIYEKIRFLM